MRLCYQRLGLIMSLEYKNILRNEIIDDEVNQLIKENWKPIGGASLINIDGHMWMSQTMTRTAKKVGKKHFKSPTLREVADYIKEKDYRVSPEAFMAHYEKVDWKSNKGVKIASWKGAIATFHHSSKESKQPLNIPKPKAFKAEVVEPSKQLNKEQIAEMKKKMMYKATGQLPKEESNDE